jgi:hypothetical protein
MKEAMSSEPEQSDNMGEVSLSLEEKETQP